MEMIDAKLANFEDGVGTSYRGYVWATREDLFELFGNPPFACSGNQGDKVSLEWILSVTCDDGTKMIATIYDWKDSNWRYPRNKEYRWHVGGHRAEAWDVIYNYIFKKLEDRFSVANKFNALSMMATNIEG